MKNLLSVFIFVLSLTCYAKGTEYEPNAIYVKYRVVPKEATIQSVSNEYKVLTPFASKMFEGKDYSLKADSLIKELLKVRRLVFNHPIDPFKEAREFSKKKGVEYTEPIPINHLDSNETNDPELSRLYQLYITKTIEAWDLMTGDSVLIGIVDTGIDYEHEDLKNKIWHNPAENGLDSTGKDKSTNGIDDDNNGFIDDWRGWDFGSEVGYDNDATYGNIHGVHVAGIAAAEVNNGKGVAGMCPNALVLPVKIGGDISIDNSINNGYEGVLYAASMDCKVINCSWGSTGYSQVNELAINTASEMGALIVAAAGNDNENEKFYPASYKPVISVASTDDKDLRSGFSNYNVSVDISAPGTFIFSTIPDNKYDYMSGTSMASPVVTGAAAVLRSQFPNYSPKQIKSLLMMNADDINKLNINQFGLLGSGRVNLLQAISKVNSKAILMDNYTISSPSKYSIIKAGSKLDVKIDFENVLDSIDNLKLILSNVQIYKIGFSKTEFEFHNLATGEQFHINDGLSFTIPDSLAEDYNVKVKLTAYSNDVKLQEFYLEFVVNQSYIDLKNEKIGLTITSNGNLGYNDFPDNLQGIGFEYGDSQNAMFGGGFMITQKGDEYVGDGVRSSSGTRDYDLFSIKKINIQDDNYKQVISSKFTDWEEGKINHNSLNTTKLDISQESFLFKDKGLEKSILLKYEIYNKNDYDMDSVYAGLYFDWDISLSGQDDYIYFDTTTYTGIAESLTDATLPKVAVALLSDQSFNCYAIDNAAFADEMGVYDGFTDKEKHKTLTSGYGRLKSRERKDVSMVIGAGPLFIPAGEKSVLYFSISLVDDLDDLEIVRARLDRKVEDIKEAINPNYKDLEIVNIYPNPANYNANISVIINCKQLTLSKVAVYDILGRKVLDLGKKNFTEGYNIFDFTANTLSQGYYYLGFEVNGALISVPFTVTVR